MGVRAETDDLISRAMDHVNPNIVWVGIGIRRISHFGKGVPHVFCHLDSLSRMPDWASRRPRVAGGLFNGNHTFKHLNKSKWRRIIRKLCRFDVNQIQQNLDAYVQLNKVQLPRWKLSFYKFICACLCNWLIQKNAV